MVDINQYHCYNDGKNLVLRTKTVDYSKFAQILGDSSLSNRKKTYLIRSLEADITAAEISRLLGVTRERIRQILKGLGLETAVIWRLGRSRGHGLECLVCGQETPTRYSKYCSRECWKKVEGAVFWTFRCPQCKKINTMRESMRRVYKRRGHSNAFCNRKCFYEFRLGKSLTQMREVSNLYGESL